MSIRVTLTRFIHTSSSWTFISILAVTSFANPFATAQKVEGSINGVVTDPTGAVIPAATVRAVDQTTRSARESLTSDEGRYDISFLRPGGYSLTVSHAGFRTATLNVQVAAGAEQRQNVGLQIGSSTQTVEVTSTSTLLSLDVETGSIGVSIDQRAFSELPLVGNDIFSLTSLQPGSVAISASGSNVGTLAGSYFALGARARSNDLAIDGVESNDPFSNNFFQLTVGSGRPITTLPVDAVQQFRVESQFTAEQGANSGALINVSTQSGTNHVHGSLFGGVFNTILNARNFFNRAPERQSPLHHDSFGGSLGLPISKDRAFFFGSYEGLRHSSKATFQSYLINAQDLGTAVSKIGGPSQINPETLAVLNLLPIAKQRESQRV